jgi:putative protease
MGVERLRIDGAYLTEEEIRRSVSIFKDFMKYNEELTEDQQIRCDVFEGQSFTRGHYFRGVL